MFTELRMISACPKNKIPPISHEEEPVAHLYIVDHLYVDHYVCGPLIYRPRGSSIPNRFSIPIRRPKGRERCSRNDSKRGRATRDVLSTKEVRAIFVDSVFPCTIKRSISRGVFRPMRPSRFFIRRPCQGKIPSILAVIPVVPGFLRNPFHRGSFNRQTFSFSPRLLLLLLLFSLSLSFFLQRRASRARGYGKRRGRNKSGRRYPCR